MKIRVELTKAEVETALSEYMQRTLSATVASVVLDATVDVFAIDVELATRKKQGGTTRCSACGGFGHNVATCPGPRAGNGEEDACKTE